MLSRFVPRTRRRADGAHPESQRDDAQGYDEMKSAGLYHLSAYTYADPEWFPDVREGD
jgi:hypothetical protein